MPANFSDYLQTPVTVAGVSVNTPWVGVWVRLVSNASGTAYISTTTTDTNGKFSISLLPPDTYTVYTGPTNVGAWTTTGDAFYVVPNDPLVFNVLDYNAKGDGVTDDTTAVQAAINAANAAGGGEVWFPRGTYIINGATSLTLTTISNVTLKGTGWASSLQVPNSGSGTQYLFLAGNASITNLVVEDLDLNMAYQGSTWSHFIVGSGTVAGLRFNRVQFRCVNYSGAIPYFLNAAATAARGLTDWHFTKCRFYNPGTQTINGMVIRGFDGCEVDGCEFVNVNNPLIPDNIFQKYNLRFTNNYEKYTVSNAGVVNMEGFDMMGCQGIVCSNNNQWSTVAQSGTSDVGGTLIDTHAGLITDGITITGNTFYGNPIQLAPQNGAPITDCVIANNTIWGTRSTGGGVNSCVQLGADAGTSSNIVIRGNTCAGTFTGAPIFIGTGYTAGAISCHDNPGANGESIQAPTEAVLVSGVTLGLGTIIKPVALTAARVVGAIINPIIGTRITFIIVQDGTGGRAVTWNAVYKVTWSDTGNTLNKRTTISFIYDGTNWNQDGAQTAYV